MRQSLRPLDDAIPFVLVAEKIAAELSQNGYSITDQFLPPDTINSLLEQVKNLQAEDSLKKAGIGKQQSFHIDREIRGDYIRWIDSSNEEEVFAPLLDRLQALLEYLNQTCFLGLKDFETHVAYYPPNTFYRKHVDRFQHNAHRVVSFVFYLNVDWTPDDGGELVLYPSDDQLCEVAPVAGRLAMFLSDMPHEVLESYAGRYSVTGWMLNQLKELTFL